jgi:hypothetical protein
MHPGIAGPPRHPYHGALPSLRGVERFAAARDFALARRAAPWAQIVAGVRAARAARALDTVAPLSQRSRPGLRRNHRRLRGAGGLDV